MDKIREYIVGCLETTEEIVELNYHENEAFINDVVARYEDNLKFTDDEYSEVDAKDDAIKSTLDFWNEMNMVR